MIIAVSWGHPKYHIERGYWQNSNATGDANTWYARWAEERPDDEKNARMFVRFLEENGFERVEIDGHHFDRKGHSHGVPTGIDAGPQRKEGPRWLA